MEMMTRASEILPSLMLPFGKDRDRERQVICSKHTQEMKELKGKHHAELKAFDDRKAKEEMKLQAFSKEQACGTPFSTSGTVAPKTGKIKVRSDYMHRKKLGSANVNPFVDSEANASP